MRDSVLAYSRQEKGVLHATEALHDFCVACNTSTSGGIFSEIISFDFPVKGHTIHTQQAGCFCFVPGGFIQGLKNCVRIGILYLIGRAALDSGSTLRSGGNSSVMNGRAKMSQIYNIYHRDSFVNA